MPKFKESIQMRRKVSGEYNYIVYTCCPCDEAIIIRSCPFPGDKTRWL